MYWFDEDWSEDIRRMRELLNRAVFNNTTPVLAQHGHGSKGKELQQWNAFRSPVCDMYETENAVIAKFELPGVDKADIDLNVTDDFVEVKVRHKAEQKQEDKKKGFYRYESRSQQFFRRVPLPANVKADKAEAEFKNGILKIELPKMKQLGEKKKKILIK
ncbi:Hsp20/alpha crystallin family protein [Candidatus Woesearchaeota archaeon]|nr:Hsp20/alpha crystallin family protein [Candidatus Woesearchaeota archaeon]